MNDPIIGLLRWIAAHDQYRRVVITSRLGAVRVGARDLAVECPLDSSDISLPAQILAMGVASVEVHAQASAEEATLRRWQGALGALVRPYEARKSLRRGEQLVLGSIPLPRRALLGMRDSSALNLNEDSAARTLQALKILEESGKITLGSLALTQPGIELSVGECVACGVCVANCPSGALALAKAPAEPTATGELGTNASGGRIIATLSHIASACRGCQECVRTCPTGVVEAGQHYGLADVLNERVDVLARVRLQTCAECGQSFADSGEVCAACAWAAADPAIPDFIPATAAAKLPPEILAKLASTPRL